MSAAAVTKDGQVTKRILKEGHGDHPHHMCTVEVHFIAKVKQDDTVFENTRKRGKTFSFPLGAGRVIRGLDLAVATMKKGEHAEIIIESDYAYGEEGMHGIIPGGATLVYDVELINWK